MRRWMMVAMVLAVVMLVAADTAQAGGRHRYYAVGCCGTYGGCDYVYPCCTPAPVACCYPAYCGWRWGRCGWGCGWGCGCRSCGVTVSCGCDTCGEAAPTKTAPTPAAPAPEAKKTTASDKALRTWTDATGRHRVTARWAGLVDGRIVRLQKADGSYVRIALERLSAVDRQLVATRGGSLAIR